MTANTPQMQDMVKHEIQTADICQLKMNFLSNITPRFRADMAELALTPKSPIKNRERYLLCCRSHPIWRNSVLSGFCFNLILDIHDWMKAKHACKPLSAAVKITDAKETCSWLSSVEWW